MSYDIAVVGAGPGGYVCAIRAAQLGLKAALIESRETLGGTCLNVGCIPSKALLYASQRYAETRTHLDSLGVQTGRVQLDMTVMQAYKEGQVKELTQGVEYLVGKNGIEWIKGRARLVGPGRLEVEGTGAIEAKAIVIATGSEPSSLPGVEIDESRVMTSTGALSMKKVPKTLTVIGGGIIGLELGSVWSRLGSDVTVVEYLDEVASGMDLEVARTLRRALTRQGLAIHVGCAVTMVRLRKLSAQVRYQKISDGREGRQLAHSVLVATGRRPCTDGLGAAEAKLRLDDGGRIAINSNWHTSVDGVYAIGDVVEGPMLAHKAEDEGIAVAEIIAGQKGHVNRLLIPSVIYTDPEAASVGYTEEELKAQNREYTVGKFPFSANPRAKSRGAKEGFFKILADRKTDEILGAHSVGPEAGELVHEVCVAMEFGAAAEDLARTCHAHPTLSEAVREAALSAGNGAIHA